MFAARPLLTLCLAAFLLSGLSYAQDEEPVESESAVEALPTYPSGFSDQATSLSYLPALNALCIGEPDGSFSLLDPQSARIFRREQIGLYPLILMASHPIKAEIAFIESNGSSEHRLHVLRFNDKGYDEIHTETLPSCPEAIDYSPHGGLLAISLRSSVGIILRQSDTFMALPAFQALCGPSAFCAIGSSESNLLQYAPQGKLIYRALPDGRIISELAVAANLEKPRLSPDKKTMYALSNKSLMRIDALTGKALPLRSAQPVSCFTLVGNKVIVAALDGGLGSIDVGSSGPPIMLGTSGPSLSQILAYKDGFIGIGKEQRPLLSPKREGFDFQALAADPLPRIDSICPANIGEASGFLISLVGEPLFLFQRPEAQNEGEEELATQVVDIPGLGALRGLQGLEEGMACIDEEAGQWRIHRISPSLEALAPAVELEAAPLYLTTSPRGLAYALRNDAVGIIDARGKASPRALIPGIHAICFSDTQTLILGRNKGGALSAPLLSYKLDSGEISPFHFEVIAVLDLAPHGKEGFAAIAVDGSEGSARTSLWLFSGQQDKPWLIAESVGEGLAAIISPGPEGRLVLSLGNEKEIILLDEKAQIQRIELGRFPVALAWKDDTILIQYSDDSLGILDPRRPESKKHFMLDPSTGKPINLPE